MCNVLASLLLQASLSQQNTMTCRKTTITVISVDRRWGQADSSVFWAPLIVVGFSIPSLPIPRCCSETAGRSLFLPASSWSRNERQPFSLVLSVLSRPLVPLVLSVWRCCCCCCCYSSTPRLAFCVPVCLYFETSFPNLFPNCNPSTTAIDDCMNCVLVRVFVKWIMLWKSGHQ